MPDVALGNEPIPACRRPSRLSIRYLCQASAYITRLRVGGWAGRVRTWSLAQEAGDEASTIGCCDPNLARGEVMLIPESQGGVRPGASRVLSRQASKIMSGSPHPETRPFRDGRKSSSRKEGAASLAPD